MARYKTALITGGSTGIGYALARALAADGTRVVICARRAEPLQEAVRTLGPNVHGIVADVGDPERAAALVDEAAAWLGGLELVIANAGFGGDRPAQKLRVEHVTPMLLTNVVGACATLTAAIPHLLRAGGGHLVGISSLAAYRGLPASAAYCASKAALSTFLESLRVDLRTSHVAVTDIRPGFVDTPLTRKNRFPMPFMLTSDEAAARILKAIARRQRVYAFPLPTWLLVRALALLPAWLYDRVGARLAPKKSSA
jgi:short-subunit dehydrogenase